MTDNSYDNARNAFDEMLANMEAERARKKANTPTTTEDGYDLKEELQHGGILSGIDKRRYLIHYGQTKDTHLAYNVNSGETDLVYCPAPHGEPVECFDCGWKGSHPSESPLPRSWEHLCPNCGEEGSLEKV